MAPMLGQDQLAGAHAQTIARGGLNGADDWMVGGDDANPNGSDWPDQGVQRTSAAGLTRILPGHAVQIRIIYMPSGLCDDGVT